MFQGHGYRLDHTKNIDISELNGMAQKKDLDREIPPSAVDMVVLDY